MNAAATMAGPLAVLVPCKALAEGKSRLAPMLDERARRELCAHLLARTISIVIAFTGRAGVHVVTDDAAVVDVSERLGVATIADVGGGLVPALAAARAMLLARSPAPRTILVLPIDLPDLEAAALTDLTTRDAEVVIAPDTAGRGTNVLRLTGRACELMSFAYGADSFAGHTARATDAGLTLDVVRHPRLAFDLDTVDDLVTWRSRGTGSPVTG